MRRHADGSGSDRKERHDLFDERDRQRQSQPMKVVDAINSEYRVWMIQFVDLAEMEPQWAMRTAFRSPRYTTQ